MCRATRQASTKCHYVIITVKTLKLSKILEIVPLLCSSSSLANSFSSLLRLRRYLSLLWSPVLCSMICLGLRFVCKVWCVNLGLTPFEICCFDARQFMQTIFKLSLAKLQSLHFHILRPVVLFKVRSGLLRWLWLRLRLAEQSLEISLKSILVLAS